MYVLFPMWFIRAVQTTCTLSFNSLMAAYEQIGLPVYDVFIRKFENPLKMYKIHNF